MDCFGTYFTHAQTCNVTRVQSATEWTASVHTLHMPKPNVTRVLDSLKCWQHLKSIVLLVPQEHVLLALQMLFSLMHLIGWNRKKKMLLEISRKNLTPASKGKNSSKRRTVGSANVPVWAYIYIYIYMYSIQENARKTWNSQFFFEISETKPLQTPVTACRRWV